ncbi:hypothetical protein SAMN05421797_1026 [Maribacter ulvicola]|uniref:Uncharacterized protein n=1 Tax=Maribacter ulvicola TaxID=228959 RepID=A0A1N6TK73_9FLAO|nr:hypothetical protein SAMN05421797_1026 [Maribacter ulvicola]
MVLYVLFNSVFFFIEINTLFGHKESNHSGSSGVASIDDVLKVFSLLLNVLESIAIVGYLYVAIGVAIIALILFVPVQVYYINRKFKNYRKKFWYSLMASFAVVILVKLVMYSWMYIDMNYL